MTDTIAKEGRPFGFWTATAMVIGGMIGAGIFVLPAQLAPYGATGAAGWVAAIAGAVVIAWVFSRLFAVRPEATGAMEVVAGGLGPLPAMLVAWSYWVSLWCANAVLALTASRYLAEFWPWLGSSTLVSAFAALAMLWALTLFNLLGARDVGRLQVVTVLLKLMPLVVVVLILAGLAFTDPGRFATNAHAPFDPVQITPALGLAFFALLGFECAGVCAERVRDPGRIIPLATMAGVVVTGALYLLVSTGIVYAMPGQALADSGAPIALFVGEFLGSKAGLLAAAFAMISALGCLNGYVLLVGEVPLGMARSGLLPRWMARTSSRDVPVAVMLIASALASVLILSNAFRTLSGLMTFMLNITAAATIWLYLGACASAWVQRVARPWAALGFAFSIWVMIGTGWEAAAWSVVLMLSAVPLYWLRGRAAAAA
ncbi:amino acid permease [Sphingomonas sp. AOB5]|uniref:APC family permease n=1 Tax=Sphingomonas sp. AOB5 TaxID=3034017 RepID=UPI0023F8EB4E|nr:amino acid permease [Sphingomonas sp. AOB5]MDF7774951.1 amino acid permease [Sphingomonas sp. AOB5]